MLKKLLKRGIVQVYYGEKPYVSYAALGQVIRARGHNMPCLFIQFKKNELTGSLKSLKNVDTFFAFEEFELIQKLLLNYVNSNKYDIIVLDDSLDIAQADNDFKDLLLNIIETKPFDIELILTGSSLPKAINRLSHLITLVKRI